MQQPLSVITPQTLHHYTQDARLVPIHLATAVGLQAEASAFTDAELKRAEAAALVERRMAAMEATMAKRRNLPTVAPEPQAARGPGADLRFSVSSPHLVSSRLISSHLSSSHLF